MIIKIIKLRQRINVPSEILAVGLYLYDYSSNELYSTQELIENITMYVNPL